MVKVIEKSNKLYIYTAYNEIFIRKVKGLKASWDSSAWVVPIDNKAELKKLLLDIYGEDGYNSNVERVTIEIDLDTYSSEKKNIYLDSICIASRIYRDSAVKVPDNVIVSAGCFRSRGGSVNNPLVSWEGGTTLKIKKLPLSIYNRVKDLGGIILVNQELPSLADLIKEKNLLQERLNEINGLINA